MGFCIFVAVSCCCGSGSCGCGWGWGWGLAVVRWCQRWQRRLHHHGWHPRDWRLFRVTAGIQRKAPSPNSQRNRGRDKEKRDKGDFCSRCSLNRLRGHCIASGLTTSSPAQTSLDLDEICRQPQTSPHIPYLFFHTVTKKRQCQTL